MGASPLVSGSERRFATSTASTLASQWQLLCRFEPTPSLRRAIPPVLMQLPLSLLSCCLVAVLPAPLNAHGTHQLPSALTAGFGAGRHFAKDKDVVSNNCSNQGSLDSFLCRSLMNSSCLRNADRRPTIVQASSYQCYGLTFLYKMVIVSGTSNTLQEDIGNQK